MKLINLTVLLMKWQLYVDAQLKSSNKRLIVFVCCFLFSACTVHYPTIHLYDGTHKNEQQLSTLWNFNGSKFTVDGDSIFPYLPPKPLMRREVVDAYLVLPGTRDFVFTESVIIGYKSVTTCTTQCTYCPKDDESCVPVYYESCYTSREPKYKTVESKKIPLQLQANHKYFITIKSTVGSLGRYDRDVSLMVETRDLGEASKFINPIAKNFSINSDGYKKIMAEGLLINTSKTKILTTSPYPL